MIGQVTLPEGTSGNWRIERFTISKEDTMLALFGYGSRAPRPGTYTRLMRGGQIVMSDTPAEMHDHYEPVRRARGRVLINGLGLGMVLQACLEKSEVEHVVVVELSEDVISLVAPHYQERYGDRLTIVNADAYTWKPVDARYAVAWHDIWDDLCVDNLEGMARLKRKYARRVDWQGCWAQAEVRAYRDRNRRSGWRWA